MIPDTWQPHHRADDGELLGWLRVVDEDVVAVSRLGHDLSAPTDWVSAESMLDERGLGWLAEQFVLTRDDGTELAVRVVEVTPDRVVVKEEDYGDMTAVTARHVLPFPAPSTLRMRRPF